MDNRKEYDNTKFYIIDSTDIGYVQVPFSIPNEDTKNREFGAYNVINDNYPKYVITLDNLSY